MSDRRLPTQHPLLRNLQHITPILRQQIQRMGDMGNVLDIAVLEALAMQRFQQVAGGAGTGIGILAPVIPWAAAKDKPGAPLAPAAVQMAMAKAARASGDIRCPICEACREGKCDLGATA